MINQGLIDDPVFSFRVGSSEEDGGEAVFGGIDPSAYTGKIEYVPVRRKAYWEVELEKVSFGDEVLELENTGAAIDTGSSLGLIFFCICSDSRQALPSSHSPPIWRRCSTLKSVLNVLGMGNTQSSVPKFPVSLSCLSTSVENPIR